jgi:hypothetical protein
MNNLGCIYLKQGSFEVAKDYLKNSIEIQNDLATDTSKKQKDSKTNSKDELSMQFVGACRYYNRGLVNQRYILKLIKEHVPNYSLTSYVKKIPDQNSKEVDFATNATKPVRKSVDLFLQQAASCAMNRIAGRHIFQYAFK